MPAQYHRGRIESTFRTESQKLGDRAHVRSFDHDLLPPYTPSGEQHLTGIKHNTLRSQTPGHVVMSAGANSRNHRAPTRTERAHPANQGSAAALFVAFGFGVLVSRVLPSR